jgi:hypothetical protein
MKNEKKKYENELKIDNEKDGGDPEPSYENEMKY